MHVFIKTIIHRPGQLSSTAVPQLQSLLVLLLLVLLRDAAA